MIGLLEQPRLDITKPENSFTFTPDDAGLNRLFAAVFDIPICSRCYSESSLGNVSQYKNLTLCEVCGPMFIASEKKRYNLYAFKAFKDRQLCLEKLGYKCNWPSCEITQYEFLAFDHINDDGAEHRRQEWDVVDWFIREDFPEGVIQLLCHNHNWLKELRRRRYGSSQNPKHISNRKYHAKLRLEVFTHYGLVCTCCMESDLDLLTIDHINGGGSKHLNEIGGNLYRWLIKNGFPDGFRTLCSNCNKAMGAYGYCPHQVEKTGIFT